MDLKVNAGEVSLTREAAWYGAKNIVYEIRYIFFQITTQPFASFVKLILMKFNLVISNIG